MVEGLRYRLRVGSAWGWGLGKDIPFWLLVQGLGFRVGLFSLLHRKDEASKGLGKDIPLPWV